MNQSLLTQATLAAIIEYRPSLKDPRNAAHDGRVSALHRRDPQACPTAKNSKLMKEEHWIAINKWRACKASMTVRVYERLNPSTDEVETVREIASIKGVADCGSARIWTRGTPSLEQMRCFLPLGFQWVLDSTTDGDPELRPLSLQAPEPLPSFKAKATCQYALI